MHAAQIANDVLAQAGQQIGKQGKGFQLKLGQRVALTEPAQADNLAQMFQRQKMLAPMLVEGLQQNGFFDLANNVRAQIDGARRHEAVGSIIKPLGNFFVRNTLFRRPIMHRQVERENIFHRRVEPVHIPLLGIGFGRNMGLDQFINGLMAHHGDGVVNAVGFHKLQTLLKHHFALVVHHIVIFQNIFANVEIARFDFLLRALKCFIDPGMNNRLTVFQAEALQHAIHAVGAENAH